MTIKLYYEEEGTIFHGAAEAPKEKQVHGQIDWQRRFDMMQQHLGHRKSRKAASAKQNITIRCRKTFKSGCNKAEKRIDIRPSFQTGLAVIDGKGGGSSTYVQGIGMNKTQISNAAEVQKSH